MVVLWLAKSQVC